ncbi:hypothetical protein BDV98DRAFT_562865 [Pterulicium gracile]|uniref:Uncharacterized protein n=1 Tax=Pterulicium gracile TaxID=1884261 RepID=A0A5C3QS41_9AGAR|nr:hypothetical protein BDV98DRAFT_562865 [Pterula gracilis]
MVMYFAQRMILGSRSGDIQQHTRRGVTPTTGEYMYRPSTSPPNNGTIGASHHPAVQLYPKFPT